MFNFNSRLSFILGILLLTSLSCRQTNSISIEAVKDLSLETETAKEESIKFLTYNIHMWEPKVDDLVKVIRNSGADVIGLQEAWTESKNLELAKKLGYNVVFGGYQAKSKKPRRAHWIHGYHMPQVLLTRHKIIESKHFNAMEAKKDKNNPDLHKDVPIYRGGTLAVLETKNKNRFVTFVLHLHPWGGPDNERMVKMRLAEMKGIQSALKEYAKLPIVLLGDFNTLSHRDKKTGYQVTTYLEKQGYKDLYRTVHADPKKKPGLTCGDGRIDFIFYTEHFKAIGSQVLTEGVLGSKGFKESDHLGVLGALVLKSKKS